MLPEHIQNSLVGFFIHPEKRKHFVEALEILSAKSGLNGSSINFSNPLVDNLMSEGIVCGLLREKIYAIDGSYDLLAELYKENNLSFVISPIKKENFLIFFQGAMGWRDRSVFWQEAGTDNIKNFKETGIIPKDWNKFLHDVGGGMPFSFIAPPTKSSGAETVGIIGGGDNQFKDKIDKILMEESIPKSAQLATLIIEKMIKIAGVCQSELENILGWSKNSIYARKRATMKLATADIRKIAELKNVSVYDLFTGAFDGNSGEPLFETKKDQRKIGRSAKEVGGGERKESSRSLKKADSVEKEDRQLNGEVLQKIEVAKNKALHTSGKAAIIELDKQVFIGELAVLLQGYSIEYQESLSKIIVRKEGWKSFEIDLTNYPF